MTKIEEFKEDLMDLLGQYRLSYSVKFETSKKIDVENKVWHHSGQIDTITIIL